MNTPFLLMAQYGATAIIPLDRVCADYFSHLTPSKFSQKLAAGEIDLPVFRADPGSQKTAKGIAVADLAKWIDRNMAAARKECEQLTGTKY